MTENIPNVLHHIRELKDTWRRQDFTYTKQQQEEYDLLLSTRRERVKQFYAEGRVFKGSYKAKEEDWYYGCPVERLDTFSCLNTWKGL